jgi:hypothetical protein
MKNLTLKLLIGIALGTTALLFSSTTAWGSVPQESETTLKPLSESEGDIYVFLEQKRQITMMNLQKYIHQGNFPFGEKDTLAIPKNDPHFDPKQPLTHRIMGPNGALCAVAYLISESGHEILMKHFAKERNHFCVGKDKNKAVEKWILSSGLTLEEVIDIQRPGMIIETGEPGEIKNRIRIKTLLMRVGKKIFRSNEESLRIAVERYMQARS